ncbi:MAG: endo-1,4-beta-xylanase, partial [Planctomycetota bacterium]
MRGRTYIRPIFNLGIGLSVITASLSGPGSIHAQDQEPDLSHRQTQFDIEVRQGGAAAAGATVSLDMTQHDFRFGTSVLSDEFLNDPLRQNSLVEAFSSLTIINGFHWQFNERTELGLADEFYEAVQVANDRGVDVRGHAVIYPNNRVWLNPRELLGPVTYDFDSQTGQRTEIDNSAFHDPEVHTPQFLQQRIADRIAGVLESVDGQNGRPLITEFDATNELIPRNTQEAFNYFGQQLVDAGLYDSEADVVADWYQQMRAARPDARLVINDYGLINATSNQAVRDQAARINEFIAAGAPIDAIGVQAHLTLAVSYEDVNRRINLLSELTGLPVEITEFDNHSGATLTAEEQRQNFENVLRAAFENPNVTGFTLWGAYDDTH